MKKKRSRKLQLNRETIRNMVHGTFVDANRDTVEPVCHSKSLDPPTCCDTCPTVACDCDSNPCVVPRQI